MIIDELETQIREYAAKYAGHPDRCLDRSIPLHLTKISPDFDSYTLTVEGSPQRFIYIITNREQQVFWIDPISGKMNQIRPHSKMIKVIYDYVGQVRKLQGGAQ